MRRIVMVVLALALAASGSLLPIYGRASGQPAAMHFEFYRLGPPDSCGNQCKPIIAAYGAITAETPREFDDFANSHDLSGATVVLDSNGGSVHGAIALGRNIRQHALNTSVGRAVDVTTRNGESYATISSNADCESMCAFVLLAGVHRAVPDQARVMVHQIWLGDRRDDPTAANYSAEDLVLVQQDIGRLAQYTAEMGVSMDMLDLSLRIPPWEPMHTMTSGELHRTGVTTDRPNVAAANQTVATPAVTATPVAQSVMNGAATTEISERHWAVVDHAGTIALARRHPLTVEGETIGTFDLLVSCGTSGDRYEISYIERRHRGENAPLPMKLLDVTLRTVGNKTVLKVMTSERQNSANENSAQLVTRATGSIPAAFIDNFASRSHSITVATKGAQQKTAIRIGNTGVEQNLPQLISNCRKPLSKRAELDLVKIGGVVSAK